MRAGAGRVITRPWSSDSFRMPGRESNIVSRCQKRARALLIGNECQLCESSSRGADHSVRRQPPLLQGPGSVPPPAPPGAWRRPPRTWSTTCSPPLPVRQWVLAVPKRLRGYLVREREALSAVLYIFLHVIARHLQQTSPLAAPARASGQSALSTGSARH